MVNEIYRREFFKLLINKTKTLFHHLARNRKIFNKNVFKQQISKIIIFRLKNDVSCKIGNYS